MPPISNTAPNNGTGDYADDWHVGDHGDLSVAALTARFRHSTLTVTAATLVSIAVTPANPTIAKSATENFVATGTYSDTTTKVITTSVTWSSSDTTIATIAPTTGIATATTKTGSTTITATSGSGASAITGNTKLTVGVGPFAYAANTNGGSPAGTISAFTEGSAGDLTAEGTSAIAAGKNPLAVTTDPLGKYVYVINQIDETSGSTRSARTVR